MNSHRESMQQIETLSKGHNHVFNLMNSYVEKRSSQISRDYYLPFTNIPTFAWHSLFNIDLQRTTYWNQGDKFEGRITVSQKTASEEGEEKESHLIFLSTRGKFPYITQYPSVMKERLYCDTYIQFRMGGQQQLQSFQGFPSKQRFIKEK